MEYIKRHIEDVVLSLSKSWPVILLTGSRQVGKTTTLSKLSKEENIGRRYVSLDDLDARRMAKEDPGMFLQLHQPPVLIDEVQYAPELFTYIKIYVDKYYHPGDFWLTGSQIFRLMRGVQESLAGRVAILNMSPLSQREITGIENIPFTPDFDILADQSHKIEPLSVPGVFKRIWNGSMPGLLSDEHLNRNIFYSSYLSTYIGRDVRDISGSIDALKFTRFITSVASRTAQLLNYQAISLDADIDQLTCKNWINILETLGIIFLLHPYSNNVLKRTIKTPKIYFHDTGLVCYLTRWSSPEVAESGAMSGALLENFAISEIVKGYHNSGRDPYLHYYRDRDAKEIDVIMEHDGMIFPLEIKKTTSPSMRLIRSFNVLDKPPLKIGTSAILCMAGSFGALDRTNLIVPIWMI